MTRAAFGQANIERIIRAAKSVGAVVQINLNHRILRPDGLYVILEEFGGVVVKRLEIAGRDDDGEVLIDIIAHNPRHSRKQEKASELQIIGRVAGRFSVM